MDNSKIYSNNTTMFYHYTATLPELEVTATAVSYKKYTVLDNSEAVKLTSMEIFILCRVSVMQYKPFTKLVG